MTSIRRLGFLAALAVCTARLPAEEPQEIPGSKRVSVSERTFTYKTVGDLQLRAVVYRADDDVLRPVVLWIHGGALILGNRSSPRRTRSRE